MLLGKGSVAASTIFLVTVSMYYSFPFVVLTSSPYRALSPMTTTYHSSFPPPHDTKVHTVRPLTQTQPSTLGMHFALGSKAKMALTNSISRLNSKFHMPTFSSGTYSGVIQNQSTWSGSEQCVWVVVLLVGVILLYGNRVALPLALAELEVPEVRDWVLYRKVG